MPGSYQTLASQEGNFPVFEGTSLYSLRLDQNVGANHRLTFRANVSPSTVTGIEVSGQDQPFGQNAYSRTSQQTYRDVAGVFQDTWTIGNNKVNEFRFQYARRGLSYFYNTKIPGGSDPAVNIPGFAYFGREPYSYIQRVEQRYQFTDNFSWTIGRHNMKFGGDLNYLPLTAIFTVNYGGVYDFGTFSASSSGVCHPRFPALPFPDLSPVQAYGAGLARRFHSGHRQSQRLVQEHSDRSVLAGFVARQSTRHAELWRALRRGDSAEIQAAAGTGASRLQPAGIAERNSDRQEQHSAAHWPGVGSRRETARRWCARRMECFYDHPLLGLYFLGDASDGSSSGQLAFAGTSVCSGAGQSRQPECDYDFPGTADQLSRVRPILARPL